MTAYGTRHEEAGGRLVRVVDRTGAVHAELTWREDTLLTLAVPGAIVRGEVIDDPLLGAAHAIDHAGTPPRRATTMSAIDWARPAQIPALAAPAALPPGAGATLMNTLAVLAHRAGVPALHYAGPYPTPALWTSLCRSFRTSATEAEFTRDALARAARVARDPIPIELVPAPHERLAIAGGHVELRDGVERVVLDGIGYVRDGSPARLVDGAPGVRAEVWFGDAPWAHVASLGADGALLAGPHALPPCTSDVVGKAFPPALTAAIAELVAEVVPAPLAGDARALVAAGAIRWADLGARAAGADAGGFTVHAALWDRIAPHGMARLALALTEALAPVVTTAAVAAVSRR